MSDNAAQVMENFERALEALVALKRQEGVEDGKPLSPVSIEASLIVVNYSSFDSEGFSTTGQIIEPTGGRQLLMGMIEEAKIRFQMEVMEHYRGDD